MIDKDQFETVGDNLLVRAPAKINLSLLIAGKRPDGYHEIETIMAKVNWYDEILIEPGRKKGIELTCNGPCWAPDGPENLVYKACELLLKNYPLRPDLHITLTKNIPAGSGLGSASSDAAAALIGLNEYLHLNTRAEKMHELAAELGSDVAFFLHGPLAFCTGRGEKVRDLSKIFDFLAILILPNVSVSTKTVYNDYIHNNDIYRAFAARINELIEKNSIDFIVSLCANMLQTSCFHLYKEFAELKKRIESIGLSPLCLSGSGSTMYYIVPGRNKDLAGECQQKLNRIGCKSILVSNNGW